MEPKSPPPYNYRPLRQRDVYSQYKLMWNDQLAQHKIEDTLYACGLEFSQRKYKGSGNFTTVYAIMTDGIKLSPHKNTRLRKRETGYLVCVEYYFEGSVIMKHVEPWVVFPSDLLISKMMLLPRKVTS